MFDADVTVLVSEEDIATILSSNDLKYERYFDQTLLLDFATTLLYHLERALEVHFGQVGKCQCMTSLQVVDLKRGYCPNCFGNITVRVSGKAITE